jgi:glutamine amidotransferase-like uncharacterized protein
MMPSSVYVYAALLRTSILSHRGICHMFRICLLMLLLSCPLLLKAQVAVVFAGAGTCDGCAAAVAKLLRQQQYQVRLVDEHQLDAAALRSAELYVQPGGSDDIMDTLNVLSDSQMQWIRDFVQQGGQYLGICAGGYLAAQYADQAAGHKAFALVELEEIDQEIAGDNSAQLIPLRLPGEATDRHVYYQAGPHFGTKLPANGRALGYYAGTRHIAARISDYGKGRVGLIGPHYEADASWYAADQLPPQAAQHQDLLFALLKQLRQRP